MIRFGFDGSDVKLQTSVRAKGGEIIAALIPTMDALDTKLQAHVQKTKLEGQVLAHRSGKLTTSVRVVPAHVEGASLVGAVEAAGGPAWYGLIHEKGGSFTAQRHISHPSHLVRRKNGEKAMTGTPYTITFPMRAFMKPSEAEMRPTIEQTLLARISEVLGK